MLNKVIKFVLLTLFAMFNVSSSTLSPIVVKGEINLTDINEDILINLSVDKGMLNEVILLDLYVNETPVYYQKEFVASYLKKKPISIEGFKSINEQKHLKINIGYREMIVEDSYIDFTINSPNYNEYIMPLQNSSFKQNENPTKIIFYMNHNDPKIYYEYESVSFIGKTINQLYEKRVLDLTNHTFYIKSNSPYELDYIELRIYHKFKNTDLFYKDNLYTIVEIPVYKENEHLYKLNNDNIYYIDERNSGIYLNENDFTHKDLLPFFIPLHEETKSIDFEYVLYDIGLNHATYIYKGTIILNNKIDFSYQEIKDVLYDVTYQ